MSTLALPSSVALEYAGVLFAAGFMANDPSSKPGTDALAGQISEALALADELGLHLVAARLSEILDLLGAKD